MRVCLSRCCTWLAYPTASRAGWAPNHIGASPLRSPSPAPPWSPLRLQDLLIPSAREGPRLQRALPRAQLRVEKGRSHALLQVCRVLCMLGR